MTNREIQLINNISREIQLMKIDISIAKKEEKTSINNTPISDDEYNTMKEFYELLKVIDRRVLSYMKVSD